MKTVLDFNGYFDSKNRFQVKEYSLYSFNRYGGRLNDIHEILGPSNPHINSVDLLTQRNYFEYYKKYGIKWTTRTFTTGKIAPEIPYYLLHTTLIFVADLQKEKMFYNYLKHCVQGDRLFYNVLRLQDIGYESEANDRERAPCDHHLESLYKNCAKDNVLDMVRFVEDNRLFNDHVLKQLHVAVDFNNWGTNYYGMKELSIINISHDGEIIKKKREVAIGASKISPNANLYGTYFDKHGIGWEFGTKKFKNFRFKLSKTLGRALFIYVKNGYQKEILCQVNENVRNKIVRLDKFGYIAENFELSKTKCAWHHNPNVNNCAEDNAKFMADWLISNGLYNKSRRDKLMQLQIQSKFDSYLASQQLANKAQYYQSINKKFQSPVNFASTSSCKTYKRKLDDNLTRYYESFESMEPKAVSPKRQRIDNTSVDSHEDYGDIDPDFTEYLDKNDIRFLTFDPEIFNRVTDELMVKKEEVDDEDSDKLSLERLLTDSESSPDIMYDFDADEFDRVIFRSAYH